MLESRKIQTAINIIRNTGFDPGAEEDVEATGYLSKLRKHLIEKEIENKKYWDDQAGYKLTENQFEFVRDANHHILHVDFEHSGDSPSHSDRKCPAIFISKEFEFKSESQYAKAHTTKYVVLYASV